MVRRKFNIHDEKPGLSLCLAVRRDPAAKGAQTGKAQTYIGIDFMGCKVERAPAYNYLPPPI